MMKITVENYDKIYNKPTHYKNKFKALTNYSM